MATRLRLTFEEYRAIDAVNVSRLNDFVRSPAYCAYRMSAAEEEETKALRMGLALHTAFLEPDNFVKKYATFNYDGRTREGKAEREEAQQSGKKLLPLDEYAAVIGMRESLRTHPYVAVLEGSTKYLEDSVVFDMPLLGNSVACKSRRDIVGDSWVAEVKTTSSLDFFSPLQISQLGYHRQAAFYTAASTALREEVADFFFFVVANTAPYESAVYRLDTQGLEQGKKEIETLLYRYIECKNANFWPLHVPDLQVARVNPSKILEQP